MRYTQQHLNRVHALVANITAAEADIRALVERLPAGTVADGQASLIARTVEQLRAQLGGLEKLIEANINSDVDYPTYVPTTQIRAEP